jgi:energy-coupling factor transporter ATP-binding protein EcfA2
VYLVTHDVDLALAHADRILLFRAGEIVADGSPAEVIEDEDRWTSCNLRVTSLMRANTRLRGASGRFLDAEALAAWIRGREGETSVIDDPGVSQLEG